MRRLIYLFFLLLVVSGIAYWLVKNNADKEKGLLTADRGFAIESMDMVNKLVIKHKNLPPKVFTKNGKSWTLNGVYDVDPDVFINIEKVLVGMRLLYVPPANSTKSIKTSMLQSGIQVDLYEKQDDTIPLKMFIIGSDAPKSIGTYMLMANETQPYVMHLPGLEGGLRSRFSQPEKNYRNKYVAKYALKNIESVKVEYPKYEFASFQINQRNGFELQTLLNNTNTKTEIKEGILKRYLENFESFPTEHMINDHADKKFIANKIPDCQISIKGRNQGNKTLQFYTYYDADIQPKNHRTPEEIRAADRVFVIVDSVDLYTVQTIAIKNVFLGIEDLKKFDQFIEQKK